MTLVQNQQLHATVTQLVHELSRCVVYQASGVHVVRVQTLPFPPAEQRSFEPLIVLLFGAEFKSAAGALLILLPGTYLLGLEVIMAGDISGRGYPWPAAIVWIVMAVLNIIGYLIFIPMYGIEGAALSTSIVFIIVFIFMTIYLKRLTNISLITLFVPTRADLHKLLSFPKLLITSRLK